MSLQFPVNKISTDWENALGNGSFTTYFLHQNQRKRLKRINIKSSGDRLGRQEERKQGNLWDWIKSKIGRLYFFYRSGYRLVNNYQDSSNNEGFCGLSVFWCSDCALRGLEKGKPWVPSNRQNWENKYCGVGLSLQGDLSSPSVALVMWFRLPVLSCCRSRS